MDLNTLRNKADLISKISNNLNFLRERTGKSFHFMIYDQGGNHTVGIDRYLPGEAGKQLLKEFTNRFMAEVEIYTKKTVEEASQALNVEALKSSYGE